MTQTFLAKETAYAVLTEVFNKFEERYLNTTNLPYPDMWREYSQLIMNEEVVDYKMVQISSETDDNIYLVSQLRYLIDKGEMELVLIYDGLEIGCVTLDLSDGFNVDIIVDVMIKTLEELYEQYEMNKE